MADHPSLAHGAEQAAVAHVGVDAHVVAQVGDRPGGAFDDVAAYVVAGLGEHPGEVAGPVHRQRVTVLVADAQWRRGAPERELPVEVDVLAEGVREPDPGGADQLGAQHLGPGDLPPAAAPDPVPVGGEGPDVLPVEGDHHRVHHGRRHDDVLVGHVRRPRRR